MDKKGDFTLKALILLIISVMVVVAFYQGGFSYGNMDAYYKISVAKDIALIVDSAYALPGDVELNYNNNLSKYSVIVDGNIVKVYSKSFGAVDFTGGEYKFFGPEIKHVEVSSPENFVIKKSEGKITFYDSAAKSEAKISG